MYAAYITCLKDVRKHPNADRLQIATCFGNNVIVDLKMYEGQKVIYFPVDGQISLQFAQENNLLRIKGANGTTNGGYLDPVKRNIMPLKLRGERSEGICLPVEVLSPYCDITGLEEGMAITVLNGVEICRKYIPVVQKTIPSKPNAPKKEKPKTKFIFFKEHEDTKQLAYYMQEFHPGELCYITLKMHGTSGRTSLAYYEKSQKLNWFQRLLGIKPKVFTGYEYVTGTRRTVLESYDSGFYGSNQFREKYHNLFKGKLHKGETVYYEIVGYVNDNSYIMEPGDNFKVDKLMGNKDFSNKYGPVTYFTYGCNPGQSEIYIYRMTLTTSEGYTVEYPWELVKKRAEEMGIKHVIELDKFFFTTPDDLIQRVESYVSGEDLIGKTHVREGIVVRIENRDKFTAFKSKNFEFKVLEGIIKDSASCPDMEEAQEIYTEAVDNNESL